MSPDWSPQGDRITYTRWNWNFVPEHAYSVVYIANADGTNKQPLTDELEYNNYSVFSPDGRYLLWSGVDDVFRYNLTNGGMYRLTSSPDVDEWGPDWQATS
jgi:Tol biopolymer transport system component